MKEKILFGLKWFFKSFIWLFIVLLGLDILSKQLVMHSGLVPNSGDYINWGFVHIGYVLNEGAAFGMGTGNALTNRIIYLVVASLISIGLVTYMIIKRKDMKMYIRACLVMVVTGAIGNMIDRIFYTQVDNRVVDWIDFWWFWDFNFNIADCCIVISAFMLIIYIIVTEVKEVIARRNAELAEENSSEVVEQSITEDENDTDDDADDNEDDSK